MSFRVSNALSFFLTWFARQLGWDDPYAGARPLSTVSSNSNLSQEERFIRRQTRKGRGETKKVTLEDGHWIFEYPVPTPVLNAIEPKWRASKTTEFT